MNGGVLGNLLTFCLFGAVGVFAARRMNVPVRVHTWVILVSAVVLGSFVGVNTAILSVLGVRLSLNWAIVSCCLGILVGLLVRTRTFTGSSARTA